MKIEIKNVKFAAFASEETNCFEATVYIDGKRSFIAKNDGHGGCDDYQPIGQEKHNELWPRIQKINAELGKETIKCFEGTDREFTIKNDLEVVVGNLLNDWLREKSYKKIMKKITWVESKGDLYSLKLKVTPENIAFVKEQKWWKPEFKLLAEMPKSEALLLV